MQSLRPLLGLLALLSPALWASPMPDLMATLQFDSREMSADGIDQRHSYRETWIRQGNTLWSERQIPESVRHAFEQQHEHSKTPHKHFIPEMAARWVTQDADGQFHLEYVDGDHKQRVFYPATEYGQAGFRPDWAQLSRLFDPAQLKELTATGETGEHDSRWYERRQGDQILRVLWSDSLQLALAIDRQTQDGYRQYHMRATLAPALPSPLPWQQLADYQQKEVSDFLD